MNPAAVVLKLGDDVSTDIIYPGRFMATVLPAETPKYAFADLPEFNARLQKKEDATGRVIVAGKNFGCGSSREQAVSALKGYELVVVAKSFARIFLQNAVNLGLQAITCPDIDAAEGDGLEWSADRAINRSTGRSFDIKALPADRQSVMAAGGLILYARHVLLDRRRAESKDHR